jgi:8-oxo-dGTP pyrophosphatase MutT (NUDIX family)
METAPALPAATIMLVRDGPTGLEVLVVRRHGKSNFAAGALVFPGGKVDADDHDLARACPAGELLPYRVAAIRETWEEAGILLARRQGDMLALLDAAEIHRLRQAHPHPTSTMRRILAEEGIRMATDGLVHCAHWITPEAEPRRFDTHFFIAAAPVGQTATSDGYETLDCLWIGPDAALREADAGRAIVMFPTRLNLLKLGRSQTAEEALQRAQQEPVVTVQPVMTVEGAERIIRIATDSGYELTEMRLAARG